MKEIEIHSFTALHAIIEPCDIRKVIYRGMKSVKFPSKPKPGQIVLPKPIRPQAAEKTERAQHSAWALRIPANCNEGLTN